MQVMRYSEDERDVLPGRLAVLVNRLGHRNIDELGEAAGLRPGTLSSLARRCKGSREATAGDSATMKKLARYAGCRTEWLLWGDGSAYEGEPMDPVDQAVQEHEELPLYFARAIRAHAREVAHGWSLEKWRTVVEGIVAALSASTAQSLNQLLPRSSAPPADNHTRESTPHPPRPLPVGVTKRRSSAR